MQLQGLMFMLFMLIIIPILILSTNHNVFFVVIAVALFLVSMRNMYTVLFHPAESPVESDDDMMEELEDAMNVDMKKFGTGAIVVRNLLFILFFIYCVFYVSSIWLKVLIFINIAHWVYDTVINISKSEPGIAERNKSRVRDAVFLLVNTSATLLITFVVCNKFLGGTL